RGLSLRPSPRTEPRARSIVPPILARSIVPPILARSIVPPIPATSKMMSSPASSQREDPRKATLEIDDGLGGRAGRDRPDRACPSARHPGVHSQALPHPEWLDGAHTGGRPARPGGPHRHTLQRPQRWRDRGLPPTRQRRADGLWPDTPRDKG